MNEEDLVTSFKSVNKLSSALYQTADEALKTTKSIIDEQEPGEIIINKMDQNETFNNESICENKDEIKMNQESATVTSTPYFKQISKPSFNKLESIKSASPQSGAPSSPMINPICIKNLTKTSTTGIKLKIKDNSIVDDSLDESKNEKPIENFNLVIKKNPDSSSSVVMKQSTPGFNQPNRNQQIRAPNQQQQQQTVPKLKITNPSAKQPGSFKPSSSHSMFNFIREKKLSQLKAEHEALSVPSLK